MNLLLLTEDDRVSGDLFRVSDERARHLREVLRAEPGREVRVGLLEGPFGSGRVVASDAERALGPQPSGSSRLAKIPGRGDAAWFEIDCEFEDAPPPRPPLDLIVAVPRARTLRRLLPDVAAMGADRIVLLRTWRVAKPYLSQTLLDPAEHRPLLHEGMMQGRTTREPCVTVEPLFKPFVEDRLPEFLGGARGLVAHPTAETPLSSLRIAPAERVVLAVGPEGGFLPYEVEALARRGLVPVSMGERTLRVETACVALLAQIDLLRRAHE